MLYDYVKGFQTKTHHDLIEIYKYGLKNPIKEAPLTVNGKTYRIDLLDTVNNVAYEIQRDNFGESFYSKIKELSKLMTVIIVHPISHKIKVKKFLEGKKSNRKYSYSPKNQDLYSIFEKLVSFKMPFIPGRIGFDVLLIEEQIWKGFNKKGTKKGKHQSSIKERNLLGIDKVIKLRSQEDFINLLPETLSEHFTNRDVAIMLKIQGNEKRILKIAGCLTYSLCNLGILSKVGKKGNSNVFKINKNVVG